MATYPLKNIAIGGNTYQIQGGGGGDIFWMIEYMNAPAGPSEFNHTVLSINDLAAYGVDKDGQVVSSSMEDLIKACLITTPYASCGFRIIPDLSVYSDDVDTWFALKSVYQTPDANNYIVCTFEQAASSTGVKQIVLTVDTNSTPMSLISCYGETIALGGGGSNVITIPITQIGTSDANLQNLVAMTGTTNITSDGSVHDYKTHWTDPSYIYAIKLAQDNTIVYLTERYVEVSQYTYYRAFITVMRYTTGSQSTPISYYALMVTGGDAINGFTAVKKTQ